MKNCPFCNAVLTDEANFCLYCMSSLDKKKKTPPLEKKKRKALPLILIITATLICLISSFVIITKQKDDNTINNITEQTLNNDKNNTNGHTLYPIVNYTYRSAVIGDDYSSAYIPGEKDIIITGVKTAEPSGVYYIPEQIDGKRVLGIDSLAFSDENVCGSVKKVIISDKVKTVWENAFASCVNMSDIYLTGKSIYIDTGAFSQKRNFNLTIHCSDTCDDRNFRLYKDNAQAYDAIYKYWDGGDPTL